MKLFGVLGNPVAHSLSPAMMNAAFAADGIDAIYVPFRVESEDLDDALRGLKALGAVGVNVTIPHKLGAFAWVSERTREAELVQAVNVVRFTGSGAIGHNTDVSGWWRSVEHAMLKQSPYASSFLALAAVCRPFSPHFPSIVPVQTSELPRGVQKRFCSWTSNSATGCTCAMCRGRIGIRRWAMPMP
ncbi:hypothetical protein GCM10025858_06830 [Alicyclobacillus sacchari]|uniref:shikimate dehydrogenase family protein n=1 Tax=Alicyclobacillus sacchari TaxID=392010 RepID=UPI0023E98420|nr:hypothetical protein [Alicyclobacillus sacchari]GMA56180.1 hypothetical protein GCM10025858_06830 [Alicyclobacillus sacchari]